MTKINQAVAFRMITKFETKGAINLGKAVPVPEAIVGCTFDAVTTRIIAKLVAKTLTELALIWEMGLF